MKNTTAVFPDRNVLTAIPSAISLDGIHLELCEDFEAYLSKDPQKEDVALLLEEVLQAIALGAVYVEDLTKGYWSESEALLGLPPVIKVLGWKQLCLVF